jgi:ATP synthase subunit 6
MVFSPLEQFEVNSLFSLVSNSADLGQITVHILFSNINLFTFLTFFIIIFFYKYLNITSLLVPKTTMQCFLENVISFVSGMVRENTAAKHRVFLVFVPYVLTIFSFILTSNFIGMVPYSFTVTSSLAVTLAIAAASFIGINIVGAIIHNLGFFAIFLPPGCPIFISPFIILIETVSYAARVLSLSIRLFANMMAGHTLLKILAGFA